MATTEEICDILKKIRKGDLTSEEGVRTLQALERGEESPGSNSGKSNSLVHKARWMRVIISDLDTGSEQINIRLPVNVVETGYRIGARYIPHDWGKNSAKVLKAVQMGKTGLIADTHNWQTRERICLILE